MVLMAIVHDRCVYCPFQYEPRHEKTVFAYAITAKLIRFFVFATLLIQFLYFLYTRFPASSHRLRLHSPVCVGPGQEPQIPCFSQRGPYSSVQRFTY